jgi:hypothetical protein
MSKYNMQVESTRATLKGKIKGFKNAIEIIQNDENLEIVVKNRTTHTIEFAIRELEDVLRGLEFFDEKEITE